MRVFVSRFQIVWTVLSLAAAFSYGRSASAQVNARYTGPNGGSYALAGNWDIGAVPVNNGGVQYNVTIPTGKNVEFDVAAASTIRSLTLELGAVLNVRTGRSLTATAAGTITGIISVQGAGAVYVDQSTLTNINASQLGAGEGGVLTVNATSYDTAGQPNFIALHAYNGGTVTAPNLQTFTTSGVVGAVSIAADFGNARVNLPALTTVTGPTVDGWSLGFFSSGAGSRIDVPLVHGIDNRGRWEVDSAGVINAGSLNSYERDFVQVRHAASAINTPPVAAIDGAAMWAGDGGILTVSATTYDTIGTPNYTPFRAFRGGFLVAPQLETFTASGIVGAVSLAADFDNARLYLPVLHSVTGPTAAGWSVGFFSSGAGSVIELPEVGGIDNRGRWEVEFGGLIIAPSLVSYERDFVQVRHAQSAISSPPVLAVDGAAMWAGDGGELTIRAAGYDTIGEANSTPFRAYRGGTLNAPVLQTFVTSGVVGVVTIAADFGDSTLNFPALTSMTGPATSGWYAQFFASGAASRINLPLLTGIQNFGWWNVEFGGVINAGSLSSFAQDFVQVRHAGSAVNSPPVTAVDGASFWAGDGGLLTLAATSYDTAGAPNYTPLRAFRGGTLNASSLRTFVASGIVGAVSIVSDLGDSDLDLGGLTSVTGPNSSGWLLTFACSGENSTLSLPAGVDFTGSIRFESTLIGRLINGSDTFGSAGMQLISRGVLESGGDVDYIGTDDVSATFTDGDVRMIGEPERVRHLEAGGRDEGTPGDVSANRRLGRLEIGRPGEPVHVAVVDCRDNGRRGSNHELEALYLTGVDGGDGLVLHAGSQLSMGGIQVYAVVSGQWVHLNSLVTTGGPCVAFGEGLICPDTCLADYNRDGVLNSQDFFDFLSAFFNGAADYNCTGGTDSQDFFDFITGFFSGC